MSESPTAATELTPDDLLDTIYAAFTAGYELGMTHARRADAALYEQEAAHTSAVSRLRKAGLL